MMTTLAEMPIHHLKRAIEIREQMEALARELDELMTGHGFVPVKNGNGISRWTEHSRNGHHLDLVAKKARLSAEGRAKVSAAVKARWERYRAAKARMARAK